MNIGIAAASTTLPTKTIRYYEEIGLITPARLGNGYRDYSSTDIQLLRFVQRARSLGFSVDECRQLLDLYRNKARASSDVKRLASEKVREVERKISDLIGLRDTLSDLADHCGGNDRPECPILDMLSEGDPS